MKTPRPDLKGLTRPQYLAAYMRLRRLEPKFKAREREQQRVYNKGGEA